MTRHWRIRYNNRDEYVTTKEGRGTQLEQVVKHCVLHRYALGEVKVIETASEKVHIPLILLIKQAIQ